MPRTPQFPANRSLVIAASLLALVAAGCSSSEPTASSIATDACRLADDVMAGEVGMARTAYRGQQILRSARDAQVSVDELIVEAQDVCPDTIGALPLGRNGDEVPSFSELRGLFDQFRDVDLEGLDLGGLDLSRLTDALSGDTGELDLSGLDLSQLDASSLESFDLDSLDLSDEDLALLRELLDEQARRQ